MAYAVSPGGTPLAESVTSSALAVVVVAGWPTSTVVCPKEALPVESAYVELPR